MQRLLRGANRKRWATYLLPRGLIRPSWSTAGCSSSAEGTDRRTLTRRTTSTPVRPRCSFALPAHPFRSLPHMDEALHLRYSPLPASRPHRRAVRPQNYCLRRRQRCERAQRRARTRRLGPLAPRMDEARDAGPGTDREGLSFDEPRWVQVHCVWRERRAGVF